MSSIFQAGTVIGRPDSDDSAFLHDVESYQSREHDSRFGHDEKGWITGLLLVEEVKLVLYAKFTDISWIYRGILILVFMILLHFYLQICRVMDMFYERLN